MIDFKQLLSNEKNLGKNPAAAYKVSAFENIDKSLQAIEDDEARIDLRDEAKKELETNEDSLVLSYIAGRIGMLLRPHEYNMRLNNLLLSFYEAGNWDIVKYIGALILSAGESSKALRVLGDVADLQGEEDKKWDYYERLVKSDSSDKEIIIIVADHFESTGDKQKAMNYYQRAILRLQKTDDALHIKELFQKLQYEPIPLFERLEKEAFIERMEPYETDEYLFVRYVAQTNDLIAIYHKENGERINIPYKRIKNDLGINAFPIPLFLERNLITGYIEPNAVDNPTGEHQEDNPILVTFNTIYAQRKAAPSHL